MSVRILFLNRDQLVEIHARVIAAHGGSVGIRDEGLMLSAMAQPGMQFGGAFLHTFPAGMAAAYLFHLCKNHPFVDGNTRVALAASEVFVRMNELKLNATNDRLVELTLSIADGTLSKDQLTEFFAAHIS